MPELLFEIGTEELPAAYVAEADEALAELARERLAAARLPAESLETFATPRRLALRASGLPERQAPRETLRRGPAAAAAFRDGQPTPAGVGFARSAGVGVQELFVRADGGAKHVFARRVDEGRPAREVLPDLLAGLVRDLPAGRKMRWGEVGTPFVRPVAWLLARLGPEVLPVREAGVTAGGTTRGHRFLANEAREVPEPADYERTLAALEVVPGRAARRQKVERAAADAVAAEGLELAGTSGLLDEVTDLVEQPFAVVGSFDERYLELPDEVLATVMIHHQRFFPARRPGGRLANRFVSVSNNRVPDPAVVRAGYEAVLAGRLSDARFFWDADVARPLAEHRERLGGMVFQRGLGTLLDKAERVRALAPRLLALAGGGDEAALGAALALFKADLGTQMVYEFPELAGVMGRAYAEREGAPAAVSAVLEDGVRPAGPADPLPRSREGAAVSVADRLDTLVGFFAQGKGPTGSADPFGLRRAAIGALRTLTGLGWAVAPRGLLEEAAAAYRDAGIEVPDARLDELEGFLWDRLEGLLAARGLEAGEVRAARAAQPHAVGVARHALALSALRDLPDFGPLATLYKRAANIARDFAASREIDSALLGDEEVALYRELPGLERAAAGLAAAAERDLPAWDVATPAPASLDLGARAAEVVRIKPALDAFLDRVLVNVDDEHLRTNRLTLLARVRDAVRTLGHLELL